MNSFDDMDIEEMLNNPLKNVDASGNSLIAPDSQQKFMDPQTTRISHTPAQKPLSKDDLERMEKNHPIHYRVMTLEKNIIITDKKLETLKTILEHQNDRIEKIEEELSLLLKHLGGSSQQDENS